MLCTGTRDTFSTRNVFIFQENLEHNVKQYTKTTGSELPDNLDPKIHFLGNIIYKT